MRIYLTKVKNNLDQEYTQKDENNQWVFVHKITGEMFNHKSKTSEVVGTLPGSIAIHQNGEMDMRGVYCACVVADILGILDDNEPFRRGMGDFIASC